MMDDIGLVVYEPAASGQRYEVLEVSTHLQLNRVLSRVCTALRSLP